MNAQSSTLPLQPTEFIGRQRELEDLKQLVRQPGCRLLTLVGPGGVGKTRLLLELGREAGAEVAGGAFFVPLQQVPSEQGLAPAIADAMNHPLRGAGDMLEQVIERLASMEAVFLLDNFEHLVGAAPAVGRIIARCPSVKVVVSSREPLSLLEEFTYQVDGLRVPAASGDPDFADYDAVRLFAARLTQVRPGFDLEEDAAPVARICRLVQGMPLALELAAAWGRTLSCAEIADEIEGNLDFLQTSLRNVPERHRSMRAVFDESWRGLDDSERRVLEKLSLFSGSFHRDAAQAVAGASLQMLSGLADKSLVRQVGPGRFQLHEMVRQYADEKLSESADEVESGRRRHAEFFANSMGELHAAALYGAQLEIAAAFEADAENIRSAWQWALDGRQTEPAGKIARALTMIGQYRSRYLEMAVAFQAAVDAFQAEEADEDLLLSAELLVELGWFDIRLGRLEKARQAFERCEAIYAELACDPVVGWSTDPAAGLAVLATIEGDYEAAEKLSRLALERSQRTADPWSKEVASYALTRSSLLLGKGDEARRFAEEAHKTALGVGDRWFDAYCLLELGNVALARDDLEAAKSYFQGCYQIRESFSDPEGMAVSLAQLGEVSLRQGQFDLALELFDQSMAYYRDLNDVGGQARAFAGVACASAALGYFETASGYFKDAVSLAVGIHFLPLVLYILAAIAEMLAMQGKAEAAGSVLKAVARHPAVDYETRALIDRVMNSASISQNATLGDMDAARAAVEAALGVSAQDAFALLEQAGAAAEPAKGRVRSPFDLTERELQVLRLIAQGKSNRQIAEELVISANTAANHVKSILSKTGCANRAEATAFAGAHNLL